MTLTFDHDIYMCFYRSVVVQFWKGLAELNVLSLVVIGKKINKTKDTLDLSIYRNVVVPFVRDLAGLGILSVVLAKR